MYIRFESLERDHNSRGCAGVFQIALDHWYDFPEQRAVWQMVEARRVLNWFNNRLPCPETVSYRKGREAMVTGLCWFRSDANEHIAQARYLSFLMRDLGHYIHERHSQAPGRILWSDPFQVVAAADLT